MCLGDWNRDYMLAEKVIISRLCLCPSVPKYSEGESRMEYIIYAEIQTLSLGKRRVRVCNYLLRRSN